MVKPDFSEFQFAYGITKELENSSLFSSLVAPPIFPTQKKEKKIGSDVVIDRGSVLAPLFIQYKRSDKMVRSNASEWSEFGKKYFRFDIHTSNQHNTLVKIGKKIGKACYIAPGFHTYEDYVRYHRNWAISRNSVCVDAERLPKVSDDDHRIAYTFSPLRGRFYSEPEQFEPLNIFELIDRLSVEDLFLEYDTLRGEFREIRYIIQDELDIEESEMEQSGNAESIMEWIRSQQRFLFRSTGIQLMFVEKEQ